MSVTADDVRHIAGLARIGVPAERIPALVAELNRILEHMEVLGAVMTGHDPQAAGARADGMPLREDGGPPVPLARPREVLAPEMRDGFFLVPRLSTHEAPPESGS